jgi:hypothetical protein
VCIIACNIDCVCKCVCVCVCVCVLYVMYIIYTMPSTAMTGDVDWPGSRDSLECVCVRDVDLCACVRASCLGVCVCVRVYTHEHKYTQTGDVNMWREEEREGIHTLYTHTHSLTHLQ